MLERFHTRTVSLTDDPF